MTSGHFPLQRRHLLFCDAAPILLPYLANAPLLTVTARPGLLFPAIARDYCYYPSACPESFRHVHSLNVRSPGGWSGGVFVVLSSAKIGVSSWRYYTAGVACGATEYYSGRGEAPGRWYGRGLTALDLQSGGRVAERGLEALFARGLHPGSGQRLGRAWRTDAVTGFDLTFSAPKSVSALWALADPQVAAAVRAAHRAAVQAALAYLDTHAGLSRKGTDGFEQVGTEGLVAAVFEHRSSRAGDPQLHTHALVVNKVRCVDGVWRTLDAVELFHHKKSAGMIYQAALRAELQQRLGVGFTAVSEHGQAEVAGVPATLLAVWSKRAAQVAAEAEPTIAEYEQRLGRDLSPAERARVVKTAVLKTRPGKQHHDPDTLHARWQAEARTVGWTPARLYAAVRAAAPAGSATGDDGDEVGPRLLPEQPASVVQPPAGTLARTLARPPAAGGATLARDHGETDGRSDLAGVGVVRAAGRRRAVFSRADVVAQAAAALPTEGMTAAEVLAQVEATTEAALAGVEAVLVCEQRRGLTPRGSDTRYTSMEVLTAEARVLALAERGRGTGRGQAPLPAGGATGTAAGLAPVAVAGLDGGQLAALERLVGGGDLVSVLTAPAGAGKTRLLGAATHVWEQAGYRVVGLAPSARATAELAAATRTRTDTLAKWLHTRDRLRALPAGSPDRMWAGLDERTVLVLDEASMASTLDLDQVTAAAGQAGTKVVLVGDPAQIGVVNGPGGMLAALTAAGHGVELTEIHRFTADWERHASRGLRAGDPAVLTGYADRGRLHPCPDAEQALDAVFAHWAAARRHGQDAVMLARTRADVDALNARARAAAQAAGEVHGPAVPAGGRVWQAGDLLLTRRNQRKLACGDSHVRNGDRWHVLGPGPDGGLVVEEVTGRGRVTLPADYLTEHTDYGWASTIDAAQGATTDTGIVLVRPGLDREHLYVALTRGRHANHAYITTDTNSSTDDDDHHPAPAAAVAGLTSGGPSTHDALRVLETALASSGAQHAAHTLRDQARRAAAAEVDVDVDVDVDHVTDVTASDRDSDGDPVAGSRTPPGPRSPDAAPPGEAVRRQQARAEHDVVSPVALRRRRVPAATIAAPHVLLEQTEPQYASLDSETGQLRWLVEQHTQEPVASPAVPPAAASAPSTGSKQSDEVARRLRLLLSRPARKEAPHRRPSAALPRRPGPTLPSRGNGFRR